MSNTNQPKVTEKDKGHKDSLCTGTTKKSSKEAGNHRRTKVSKINILVGNEENKISGKIKKKDTEKLRKTSNLIRKYLVENKNKPEDKVEVEVGGLYCIMNKPILYVIVFIIVLCQR